MTISKQDKSLFRQLGEVSAIGFELCISVVAGLVIGDYIDNFFKTTPLFTIIFIIIGFSGGVLNIFRLIKKFNK